MKVEFTVRDRLVDTGPPSECIVVYTLFILQVYFGVVLLGPPIHLCLREVQNLCGEDLVTLEF